MRTGVIAKKLGMSRFYSVNGDHIPVTLLQMDGCKVIAQKTEEKDGYNAVQLGFGAVKVKNVSKPVRGQFAKAKVEPLHKLAEFRVEADGLVAVGEEFSVEHFVPGQYVDVVGTSKGRGFSGAMKRHNFRGLEATHGVSISHRSHGSTGQCQDPGKVFKGKKMAGQYGDKRITMQNLEVIERDNENGILIVAGNVPGSKGGYVLVSDAVKRALPSAAPFPAGLKSAAKKEEAKAEVPAEAKEETAGDSN